MVNPTEDGTDEASIVSKATNSPKGALLNALLAETRVVLEILIRKQVTHWLGANDTFHPYTFETSNQT